MEVSLIQMQGIHEVIHLTNDWLSLLTNCSYHCYLEKLSLGSVVLKLWSLAESASPKHLQMQILAHCSRPTKSETLETVPRHLCLRF